MGRRLRTAVVAIVAAAPALAAGGCGAAHAVSQAIDPVAKAAEVTAHSPGYRLSATIDVSSSAGSAQGTMQGVIDSATHTGAITTRQSAGGHEVDINEKFQGTTVYMDAASQPILQRLSGGKPWLKLDFNRAMGVLGLGGMPTQGADPSQFVDYLRAVGTKTTRVGAQTIAGVNTTHYHVVTNLDSYPRLLPPAKRAAARRGVTNLETLMGSHTMPMDVWIDAHRLVRRVSFSFHECVQNQHLSMSMAMNLSDYGPQTVPAMPAPSQAYDITPLMARAMKNIKLACGAAT